MLAVYFAQDVDNKRSFDEYAKTITALAEHGDLEELDSLKRTALHWATIRGYCKTIYLLRALGASTNGKESGENYL